MLGFKRFRNAAVTLAGIELMHRVRKGQFDLTSVPFKIRPHPRFEWRPFQLVEAPETWAIALPPAEFAPQPSTASSA